MWTLRYAGGVPPTFGNPSSIINFSTAELSAVNRLMRERIQLPEQLNQISPEFFLLQDDGVLQATVNPRRSKRGRSAPTAAEYRPSKSVKLSAPGATTGRLSTFSSVFLCLSLSFCL